MDSPEFRRSMPTSDRRTPSGTRKRRTHTVAGEQFVAEFTQHILPRGLQKALYYGWFTRLS